MEMVLMLGMMLMMISMMPGTMMMMMATISLPGGDLPGGICPPEMTFLLYRFPHRGGGETRKQLLFRGFHPRGLNRRKGHREGPPGTQEGAWRDQEGGPRQAPFWLPGGSPHLLLRWLPVILHKNDPRKISSPLELICF